VRERESRLEGDRNLAVEYQKRMTRRAECREQGRASDLWIASEREVGIVLGDRFEER
jgi:lysylphosphatidylglycerol synthetase-like protein (DUF2156 family)